MKRFPRQRVFGVCGAFNGTFLVTPTTPFPSLSGAPGNASGRFPTVLIGDISHLEDPF